MHFDSKQIVNECIDKGTLACSTWSYDEEVDSVLILVVTRALTVIELIAIVFRTLLPSWLIILIYCYSCCDKVWRVCLEIISFSILVDRSLIDWFFLTIEDLMKFLLDEMNRDFN